MIRSDIMNKQDLLDHIEHEVVVDKTKIRDLYDRRFTVTAYRSDRVTRLGEFDNIQHGIYYKDKLYISNTDNIAIAPSETIERTTSAELDLNLDYTFRMLDTNETFEMKDLITKKSKYVLKTNVIELGDFIRFKRIYSQDKHYSGTAIITDVETFRLEIMMFNNEHHECDYIWAHELFTDEQDFEFEILAKHEYVERHNVKTVDMLDEAEDVEAEDVLDVTE